MSIRADRGPHSSMFSDAHSFNTSGGLFNSAARDLHLHYYNRPGHDEAGQQQHQALNASSTVQGSDTFAGNVSDESSNRPSAITGDRFRLLDLSRWFRTRPVETAIANIVEAEYASLLNSSSTSLPATEMVPRIPEVYLRLMLKHRIGYPLYCPEPKRGLPLEYRRKGISIGDVGRVTPDGAFDFLFNVDASKADSVNPLPLPRDFETIPAIEVLSDDYFQPGGCLLSGHVKQDKDTPITYKFSAAEGAVLQVPEGAVVIEAQNINEFYDLAVRHAQNWYEYMLANRSRSIPNGSLYLITGCIKTSNWGIGALYGQPAITDYLEFTSGGQPSGRTYGWKKSGPIATKVGPTSTDVAPANDEAPNQCVFIRGYKITLGEKLWKKLKQKTVSVYSSKETPFGLRFSTSDSSNQGSSGNSNNSLHGGLHGGSTRGHITHGTSVDPADLELSESDFHSLSISDRTENESGQIFLEGLLSTASPMHPSDFPSVALLRLEPEAEIVLTHDNDWCSSMPEDFADNPENLKIKEFLDNVAASCYAAVDQNGCVSLTKKSTSECNRDAPRVAYDLSLVEEAASTYGVKLENVQNAAWDQVENKFNTTAPQGHGSLNSNSLPTSPTAVTLRDMPIELVAKILNLLDFSSMLKCRYVCSTFRDLVDLSHNFHWKMELSRAGMEDGYSYPLSASRQMLERFQQGWEDLQWAKELRVRLISDHWVIFGPVLAQISRDASTVHFKQLPSPSCNREEREWVLDISKYQTWKFALYPGQDLLIIIEWPNHQLSACSFRILLLTMSTGDPHPLATGTYTLTHTLVGERRPQVRLQGVQAHGDTLGVVINCHDLNETQIAFWNWKTGQIVTVIITEGLTDMVFLSEQHVIFGTLQPSLAVVNLAQQPPKCQRVHEMENIFIFRLPPLAATARILNFGIESDPPRFHETESGIPVPFYTANHNCLHLIKILVRTSEGFVREVQLYALGHSFLSLLGTVDAQPAVYFDWHSWGPEGTRVMAPQSPLSQWFVSCSVGTRFISTGKPEAQQVDCIYMYDFNQWALRWSMRNSYDLASSDSTAQEMEEEKSSSYINITAPTKIADVEIFQDEIETRLGYRRRCWTILGEPKARIPMCLDEGIAIVEGTELLILTV